jgi:acyl-coenzyme A thioesterase PaaI-like protein
MTLVTLERPLRPHHDPHGSFVELAPAEAQEILRAKFAPWIQDLGLIVESCSASGVKLRLPFSARLTRVGDTVCGQALMACADSAMAIAIFCAFGEFRNVTTVGQAISFMRPIAAEDTLIEATVQKRGRTILFCEASFMGADTKTLAAHATATWAII